jgi:hypothetical protein
VLSLLQLAAGCGLEQHQRFGSSFYYETALSNSERETILVPEGVKLSVFEDVVTGHMTAM